MSKDLDRMYSPSQFNNRNLTPDESVDVHVKTVTDNSNKVKNVMECHLNISYGTSERQKLDIFAPASLKQDCPVLVFIHGGYWQAMSREQSCFMAETMVQAGTALVVIGYDLAPEASMEGIISQVIEAVKYACTWATNRKSSGVYLCGHSAGGHLVSMVIANIVNEKSMALIRGVVPVSGVFDLRPLVKTYVNDPIKMTEESAWECSPMRHIDSIINICKENSIRVLLAIAEFDPPTFHDQLKSFYGKLSDGGVSVEKLELKGLDHFTVVEQLSDGDYMLSQKLVDFMRL